MAKNSQPELIANFLSQLLRDRFKHKADIITIIPIWKQVVGSSISQQTQVSAFNRNILWISVLSSPWLTELQFLKKDIIEKLRNVLPPKIIIKDIRFQLGSENSDNDMFQNQKSIIQKKQEPDNSHLDICLEDKQLEEKIKNAFHAQNKKIT